MPDSVGPVGADDSFTYRLAVMRPSRIRESQVRSPLWPFFSLPTGPENQKRMIALK